MTVILSGMSPAVLNSTTLAVNNMRFPLGNSYSSYGHSGNEYKSVGILYGSAPAVMFDTPFYAAYQLIGLKGILLSAFSLYQALFSSGIRQATQNANVKHTLTSGASAWAHITGASVGINGILMAQVEVRILYGNATTYPLTESTGQALPTLSSEPQLHTLGPVSIGGTRIDGMKNSGFSQNTTLLSPINDGDQGPRTIIYAGANPQLQLQHDDPVTLFSSLGYQGEVIPTAAVVLYFRGIDPTLQTLQTTGLSFTVAAGRIFSSNVNFGLQQTNATGVSVQSLSPTGTHPITVAAGVTLP